MIQETESPKPPRFTYIIVIQIIHFVKIFGYDVIIIRFAAPRAYETGPGGPEAAPEEGEAEAAHDAHAG